MVTLELPYPPSVNEAFGNNKWGRGKGRYRTPKYEAWIKDADAWFTKQKSEKTVGTPVIGPYEVHMVFSRDKRRWNSDIDNRVKCVSDALKRFGLIEDDAKCEDLRATWGPVAGVFVRVHKYIGTSTGKKSKASRISAG